MLIRIIYIIYLFMTVKLTFKVVRRLQDGTVPKAFEKRRGAYFIRGVLSSFLWPIALLTPKGRALLTDELSSLR